MKNLSKPSKENLKIIGEVMYNITGLEYYLNLTQNYYQSKAMCGTYRGHFFEFYNEIYNQMKFSINNGCVFNYPLYCLKTKREKPYIYNSL